MKTYTLVNQSTGEVVKVKAELWICEDRCYRFYLYDSDKEKMMQSSFNIYNWDIREVK